MIRRISLVYWLIPAVLFAAGSLAYYGYSYSERLAERERQAVLGTMAELAKEKLIGIQTAIAEADQQVYKAIDFADLQGLGQMIANMPFQSAIILGADQTIVSGGSFRKSNVPDDQTFQRLLAEEVIPDLDLESMPLNEPPRYMHQIYGGHEYLFSYDRFFWQGRIYFVLLEIDIPYLVAEVFPTFFDSRSPNLYQVLDDEGNLVYGYAGFQGIPNQDVVEIGFPETLTKWRLRVAQRDAGALASSETRQRTLDLVLMFVAMAVIAAGLVVMVTAVRRERKVSQLKSDFISNVSHELKTPLSIISMFGELLAMGRAKSTEQAVEYAEIIRRESARLSSLIDNVLDFAKIERGVLPYKFVDDQDLPDVIDRAVEICGPRVEQGKMELRVKIAEDLPTTRLDSNAMVLAIINLIDNAIKYAPDGQYIDVEVGTEGGRLEVRVRDYGPGINPDEHSSVFERFYRAKDIRLKPVRGSGIGLSLVKHIAQAHKGGVEIESTRGKGCCFRIWLPITGSMA